MSDREKIDRYIAEHGVTVCPTRFAISSSQFPRTYKEFLAVEGEPRSIGDIAHDN